jgi:hypothetical protein
MKKLIAQMLNGQITKKYINFLVSLTNELPVVKDGHKHITIGKLEQDK